MAQGNSSNANRYKGEDIDDDGDGQVDKADDSAAIDGLPVDSGSVSSGQFLTYDGSNVVSQVVNTASGDGQTILGDSTLEAFGMVHSSNLSSVVTASASSYDSTATIADITLASNEIGVILNVYFDGDEPSVSLQVDGNDIPMAGGLEAYYDSGGSRHDVHIPVNGVVFEDSLFADIYSQGSERCAGYVIYRVITV